MLVDNRLGTGFKRLPEGLYNTMIRPLPWESKSKWRRLAAGLESPLWMIVYGLAGYGAWKLRGRYKQIIFPVLIILTIGLSGAISHGNLGTAFRHRGQMFFALAVLAMGGVQAVVDGRTRKHLVNGSEMPQLPDLGC